MLALRGRRHRVTELVFSACGRWLAAAGSYGGVHVWDTTNPGEKPKHTDLGGAYWCGLLAFRPDGKLFCCDGRYRWFLFDWGADELNELALPPVHGRFVPAPDGQSAVVADDRHPLECWTISPDDKSTRKWTAGDRSWSSGSVAFAPDGTAVACAGWRNNDRFVTIRDAATGETRSELPLPSSVGIQLAFAPNELLVGRATASLLCWNTAEPSKAPRKVGNPTRKHFQAMTAHPAGPVLTLDNDRLVRVWDAATVTPYRAIEWNIGKLYAVAVSPDGARAAVGSHTGRVLLWDWD